MKTIELPSDILRVAQLFKAKKNARFYFCGVHFKTAGFTLIIESADNGCMCKMVLPFTRDFVDCDFILPCDFKIPKKTDTVIIISGDNFKNADIVMDNIINYEQSIDSEYPSIARVIPSVTSNEAGQFDPELLMKFKESSVLLGCGEYYKLQHNGSFAATVNIDKYEFSGAVMPWRAGK